MEKLNLHIRASQVARNHYQFKRYSFPGRWVSYYHQVALVEELNPQSVLEIGVGDQVFADYLRGNTKIKYKSMDIARDLAPDILGSVDAIPMNDNSFDIVCAFQVLEHLPFELFLKSLQEMARVSISRVVISLPHYGPPIKINLKFPFIPEIKFLFKIPHHPKHIFNGQHYWEIGKENYELDRILSIINSVFEVEQDFIPFENPYHHFFVLKKKV